MSKTNDDLRPEYDFSGGVRGKHVGQKFQVIGDKSKRKSPASSLLSSKILKAIERDLMRREGFSMFWGELDRTEKNEIRAAWLARIDALLLSDE